MKTVILLFSMVPLLMACSAIQHRDPLWHASSEGGEVKLHSCVVTNQRGMSWSRSDSTVERACSRALLDCRHSYGDLHHRHRPSNCQRSHYE